MNTTAPTPGYRGIWPAMLTPLTPELSIDIPAFARHDQALLAAGCIGVTPFGTTGEGPSFSVAERIAAVDGMIAAGVPGDRILVSTSAAALPDAVALTRHAVEAGTFGCLLLPPFFLEGVPDQGIIDAYRFVIDRVADPRLRIVLYHLPEVCGVPLSHAVIGTLRALYPQTIIGLKDSGCQREDSLGYVMPRLVGRLVAEHDGPDAARDLQRVRAFIDVLGGYGMTAAFKGVMAILDGDAGWRRVRPPLVALNDAEVERLGAQMRAFALDRSRD